jgi:hypothetical protein
MSESGRGPSAARGKLKVLTFSPYSFINLHSYPEAVVVDNLRQRGHDIVQVRCKGLYSGFCISMAAVNLTPRSPREEKEAVCRECNLRRRAIEDEFQFETVYIDDFVTPEMIAEADAKVAELTVDNWTELTYDGIPIPRYAATEYVLNEKINTTKIAPELWEGYLIHAKYAFITAAAGAKILDKIKPQTVAIYNTVYSCNHVICCLGEQRGMTHYSLHAGTHHKYLRSEMTIFEGLRARYLLNRSEAWRKYSKVPLRLSSVRKAAEHIEELLEARSPWVYTVKAESRSAEALRDFFGIKPGLKIMLATMASADERFATSLADAAPVLPKDLHFESQIAWVRKLIEWTRDRKDLFLIVRVHPRDFPNKREQVLSHQAKQLRSTFVDLPDNVKVNWPDDSISLHDIAKIADVCLNATSTAGLEMLLLGVPVVIYDPRIIFSYPPELNFFPSSPEDYFRQIEDALEAGRSAQNVVGAFRWIAFKSDIIAIDIGEAYGPENVGKEETKRKKSLLARVKALMHKLRKRTHRGPDRMATFNDPFFNRSGLRHLRQADWLAYAIERQVESHIDAYCEIFLREEATSAEVEFAAIADAARNYMDRLGIPADFMDAQWHRDRPSLRRAAQK